jgi:hypothetical protein
MPEQSEIVIYLIIQMGISVKVTEQVPDPPPGRPSGAADSSSFPRLLK